MSSRGAEVQGRGVAERFTMLCQAGLRYLSVLTKKFKRSSQHCGAFTFPEVCAG